ncbi:MAG: tetratricopeptide repeat protein [Candidatus Omnitrophica bacterium]|nr:tetratricopeptide repeat protein [Candidatus Omnitrophota bacterium]
MKIRRRFVLTLLTFFTVTSLVWPQRAWGGTDFLSQFLKKKAADKQASAEPAKEGSNIEEVLSTLDETLAENRGLRKQIKDLEEELRKVPVTSNLLKAQIRSLQREMKVRDDRERRAKEAADEEIRKFEVRIKETEKEKEELAKMRKEIEDQLARVMAENEKYKQLLDQAVLGEERHQYLDLIDQSKKVADLAVKQVSVEALANERMKTELARAYYELGNISEGNGNYKGAVNYYELAVQLVPSDAWAHHNLGIVYDYYLRDREAAISHYQRYLQLEPFHEHANRIRERLLDLKLRGFVVPPEPLLKDFETNQREVELKESSVRIPS